MLSKEQLINTIFRPTLFSTEYVYTHLAGDQKNEKVTENDETSTTF